MRIVLCAMRYRRARDMNLGGEFHVLFIDGIAAYKAATREALIDALEGVLDATP